MEKHAGHTINIFARKFWVSLALTFPILLYSELPERFFGYQAPSFVGSDYLSLVLGSVIFFYGGLIFLQGAFRELRARLPGMMTLIALAVTVAYTYSVVVIFIPGYPTLFWELATLITIMLLGHWMEMRAVSSTQGALKELSQLLPDKAELVQDGDTRSVPLSELKAGDIVFIRPGGKIPVDGVVVEGSSEVNESMVTGESKLVSKTESSQVIAGTINGDGTLKVKITHIGENTFLSGVMRLIAEAQASKSRLQLLSDKAAYYLTVIAIVGGAVTFGAWTYAGSDAAFALTRVVAVLVIACPHALGLAIPLVASISTGMSAQHGFLVRQRSALELARKIDIVLFDKTGTLTEGKFRVTSFSSNDALALAAAVDYNSEHPIARGIVDEAKKQGLKIQESKNYKRIPGVGGQAEVGGRNVFVGQRGGSDIRVEIDGVAVGSIKVGDKIRPEAFEAVKGLKRMGIKVAMITGDSEDIAKQVAGELGIDEYFFRVLPGEKSEKVKSVQSKGEKVAMIGDGINDAPALVQADLGVAIGAGTNIAIESAGIILVKNDPRDIMKIIELSRATYSKMVQNLFWATGYNVVAIPLAAGVLASRGILLQPAVGAMFMSLSTVIVAVNALLLRGKKL